MKLAAIILGAAIVVFACVLAYAALIAGKRSDELTARLYQEEMDRRRRG